MKNSFAKLLDNRFSRKFGGLSVGTADPYVSGYHFIWFTQLPAKLTEYTKEANVGLDNLADIQKILAAACLSVTPPGGTLNKVDFTGLGGIKWSVPTNIDYGQSVSVKFLEFSGTPILHIFHSWVKMIRDYRTGATELLVADKDEYTKKGYAGLMFYWTTAPDGVSVEYYACYDGMFPNKDPQDLFASDVENVNRLDIEIEFNVDYMWHEPWVKTQCENFAKDMATMRTEIKEYGKKASTGA